MIGEIAVVAAVIGHELDRLQQAFLEVDVRDRNVSLEQCSRFFAEPRAYRTSPSCAVGADERRSGLGDEFSRRGFCCTRPDFGYAGILSAMAAPAGRL